MLGTGMEILGVRGTLNLLGKHVRQLDGGCVLRFTDSKGVKVSIPVGDAETAAMLVKRARDAGPEGRLFPHTSPASLRAHMIEIGLGQFRVGDFRILIATRTAREEVKKIPFPKHEAEYKASTKYVAQVVAERLAITADLALKNYIDPKVFWKWTRKWTKEDIWSVGRNGELVRVYPRPKFTAKEYAQMREESIRAQEEREKKYDAEEAQSVRRPRKGT